MTTIGLFYFLDGFFALWLIPIIVIWRVKPNKSLRDGFTDWFNESENDF